MISQTAYPGDRIYLLWGYIEFGNNEISVVSVVGDPPKIRQAAALGISLGAMSWGRLRSDGQIEEMVLVQGKQDERTRDNPLDYSGEFTIHIRDGSIEGDAAMIPVVEARHDGIRIKGVNW